MVSVGVVAGVRPLTTDEVHDLVFTLAGHTGIGDNDLELHADDE